MVHKDVKIINEAGIHCRPSSLILKEAQKYPESRISVSCNDNSVELNSILALLGMAISKGDHVTITAEGGKEDEACDAVSGLFAYDYDFPPKK